MVGSGKDDNIATHLANASVLAPDQLAIVSARSGFFEPRSFKELYREVQICADFLKAKGISKNDHVLLAVKPGYQLILIAFALFYIGAVPIIIDPGMGLRAFLKCIKNTKPSALIGISLIHVLSKFIPRPFRSIEKKVLIQSNHFSKEIKKGKSNHTTLPATTLPQDLAAIVFTSGSTGTPKGVCYSHQVFEAQINHLQNDFGIEKGEKDLATLPIFALFNPALGVTSVIPDMNPRKPSTADPKKLTRSIEEFEITTAFTSPIIGEKIVASCSSQKIKLPKIKRFLLAGAPAHPSLVHDLSKVIPNGKVILPYGATEALPISAAYHIEVNKLSRDISLGQGSCLGRPLQGNTVRIAPISFSPFESGLNCPQELPQGEVGEICVSGPVVSQEYFRMPGATVDSKFHDGQLNYHRMGDLGYFDSEGFLRFLGRKVERIITQDGPLETERCEPLINGIKEISKSALIGIGENPVKQPCLVVEPYPHIKQTDLAALKKQVFSTLKIQLPSFSFPYIVFEKSLPVDSRHNAKIHRLSLAKKWTRLVRKNPSKYS